MQSKLPFMTAVTVLLLSPATAALRLMEIVATVMAGAAFGYGLNDVADRASDARAGKPNRAAELGRRRWLPFLMLTAAGAFGLSVIWADDAVAPALVLLSLGLAVAYSVPPLRLKERGAAALAGAASAQWAVPALVVSAAEPDGWLRPAAWSFALLSLAIGIRWIAVHQQRDVFRDWRSGVRTYASRRADVKSVLLGAFACELVLLGAALAWTWPQARPAAIALAPFLLWEMILVFQRGSLPVRLAGYEDAPLAAYYFFAFPAALAIGALITGQRSGAVPALLLAVSLPQLVGRIRCWRAVPRSAMNRATASTQSPVVSASEPHPKLRLGPPQ
jgi:4-hydroxybenzoate polyprenyltransferase